MELRKNNRSSVIAGVLLLTLGLLLLLGRSFQLNLFNLFENWNAPYPIYIIVIGIFLMIIGLIGGVQRQMVSLTIVGSIVLVSGGILAFHQATNSYQTWAYLWALVFPGSIGLALSLQSITSHDLRQRKTGLNMIGVALLITMVGWSFFEGGIQLSGYELSGLANIAGPMLLIGAGVWLLLGRKNFQKEKV